MKLLPLVTDYCILTDVGNYTLSELAETAGKKERTVRYYQKIGLLRQPGRIGPGAHYTEDDRSRLRVIGQLQQAGKSLDEIKKHLAGLDGDAVRLEALEGGSALDYVRSVLGEAGPKTAVVNASQPAPPPAAPETAQWERIEVAPGIELHVKHPITSARRRIIAAYIARARNDLEGTN